MSRPCAISLAPVCTRRTKSSTSGSLCAASRPAMSATPGSTSRSAADAKMVPSKHSGTRSTGTRHTGSGDASVCWHSENLRACTRPRCVTTLPASNPRMGPSTAQASSVLSDPPTMYAAAYAAPSLVRSPVMRSMTSTSDQMVSRLFCVTYASRSTSPAASGQRAMNAEGRSGHDDQPPSTTACTCRTCRCMTWCATASSDCRLPVCSALGVEGALPCGVMPGAVHAGPGCAMMALIVSTSSTPSAASGLLLAAATCASTCDAAVAPSGPSSATSPPAASMAAATALLSLNCTDPISSTSLPASHTAASRLLTAAMMRSRSLGSAPSRVMLATSLLSWPACSDVGRSRASSSMASSSTATSALSAPPHRASTPASSDARTSTPSTSSNTLARRAQSSLSARAPSACATHDPSAMAMGCSGACFLARAMRAVPM
mmetsp:Transcript_20261/g.51269  ORF Transcript_20261/g.51269 Transcript_20261/m.51269 type:complete len:433 (-) Transcript_20261:437-1735(-)